MSKILVVDDSSFQRRILGDLITSLGYEVSKAESGESMLEIIAKEQFDCVCLDLLMPGIGGIGAMEELEGKEGVPPIIVITADIQLKRKERCLELGAVGFINKSIDKVEIEELLNKVLN